MVTLLTDFGTRDAYVAVVKGVLLSSDPGLRLVDVTHEVEPGDVAAAAFLVASAAPFFPPGTVHLVVVDPGVGSERRAVACSVGDQIFVAPDNGVLSRVLAERAPVRAHEIARPELWRPRISDVFHGRDVFAPVAAHLASGGALASVGPELAVDSLVRLAVDAPEPRDDGLVGRVIRVDRFGNLVTDVRVEAGSADGVARIGGRDIASGRIYTDAAEGELVALCGSSGLLEIACNRGSAAAVLGAAVGDVVTWRPRRSPLPQE